MKSVTDEFKDLSNQFSKNSYKKILLKLVQQDGRNLVLNGKTTISLNYNYVRQRTATYNIKHLTDKCDYAKPVFFTI